MYSNLKRAYSWGPAGLQVRLMEGSGTPAYSFPPSPLLSQHGGSARAEPGHWDQQLCCTGQQGLTQLRVAEDAYAQCYRQWEWQSWQWVDKKDQWLHYLDVLAIVGAGLFLDKTAYTVKSRETMLSTCFWLTVRLHKCTEETEKNPKERKSWHAWKQTELWMCSLAHTEFHWQRTEAFLAWGTWTQPLPNHWLTTSYADVGATLRKSGFKINTTTWQKISKDTDDLNHITDIYRTLNPITTQWNFSRIYHTPGHETINFEELKSYKVCFPITTELN